MPDHNQQPAHPLAGIEQAAAENMDRADSDAALERVLERAGLPSDARDEALIHYHLKVDKEQAENNGDSETLRRWNERRDKPARWAEVEGRLAEEMKEKAKRFQPAPRCPDGDPFYSGLLPADVIRMSERDYKNYKDDQLRWAEMSDAEKQKHAADRRKAGERKQWR